MERQMRAYFMGIDIGTYQSKGVIIDEAGTVVCQASTPHDMENPKIDYTDPHPFICGKVGLRVNNAYARFDNFRVITTKTEQPNKQTTERPNNLTTEQLIN